MTNETNNLAVIDPTPTTGTTRAEAALLACNTETPIETVAEMNLAVDGFLSFAREVGKRRDDFMREYVIERGRPKRDDPTSFALVVGTTLYTLEDEEKISCDDRAKAIAGLEEAADGDMEMVQSLYASAWFKQGAIRKLLKTKMGDDAGEKRFRELFTVEKKPKLDKDGNPGPKALQKLDLNYLAQR